MRKLIDQVKIVTKFLDGWAQNGYSQSWQIVYSVLRTETGVYVELPSHRHRYNL